VHSTEQSVHQRHTFQFSRAEPDLLLQLPDEGKEPHHRSQALLAVAVPTYGIMGPNVTLGVQNHRREKQCEPGLMDQRKKETGGLNNSESLNTTFERGKVIRNAFA
jgi:hypothetical protein